MTGTATLLLARHGQTVWHAENRYAGAASDIDLTPAGVAQADQLARWAVTRGVDAVVASPVRRAVETARPSALALGFELEIVDDLREVSFGAAEGHTIGELTERDPGLVARFRSDPIAFPFPGAEPPAAAADRAAGALSAIAARSGGRTVLVVAHNTLLRLALCALIGVPLRHYRQVFPQLRNAAISHLAVPTDGTRPAALLSLNVPLPTEK